MRAPGGAAGKPSGPGTPPETGRAPGDGARSPGGSGGSSGAEAAVVSLTNAERAKAGCEPLHVDQRLVTAARRHSADMAANGYFDHTSRNGDSPWKRMEDAGYPSPGAENIAKGYSTAAAVMKGWMDSPGHRANILNCDLRAIGVGKASGPGGPLWTQDFGWK
ncbi:CAP domain-containing protein [Actinomadura sp. KC06]|nr:CAP domain-containing protein [Actinomadura sp. KC06]